MRLLLHRLIQPNKNYVIDEPGRLEGDPSRELDDAGVERIRNPAEQRAAIVYGRVGC